MLNSASEIRAWLPHYAEKNAWSACCSLLLTAVLVLLGGCARGPHGRNARPPDWAEGPTVVEPGPALAAAASDVPEPQNAASAEAPGGAKADASNSFGIEPGTKWVPLQRWCRSTGLASLSQLTSGMPAYTLRSGQGVVVVHPGTPEAQWNGVEVRLGFAPQLINEQPYVHALDLQKTIAPLLNGGSGGGLQEPIVIDAGHGGEDAGAQGQIEGSIERDLTLDWALRVKRALNAKGLNVILTRSSDVSVALANRVALATAARAGAFISLHFNSAAPNETESGLETYCLTPAGMPSSLTRGYADEIEQVFPNNAFDAQNLQLAARVHRALLGVGGKDRGVRRARFPTVLRGQQCPAVLVEGGYLSNPAEARRILDPSHREKLAVAVAAAVAEQVGSKGQ